MIRRRKNKADNAQQTAKPKSKKNRVRWSLLQVFKFLICFAVTVLLAGFVFFVVKVTRSKPPDVLSPVDGIVVLTGDDGSRLLEGAELLEAGHGERLLISGVNRSIKPAQIQNLLGLKPAQFACCVDLDYDAKNTYGNALETANWTRALGYKKVLLVTSAYHMPRAKIELSAAMPEVIIVAYPVKSRVAKQRPWWGGKDNAKLMVREYGKLLVILGREPGIRAHETPVEEQQAVPEN